MTNQREVNARCFRCCLKSIRQARNQGGGASDPPRKFSKKFQKSQETCVIVRLRQFYPRYQKIPAGCGPTSGRMCFVNFSTEGNGNNFSCLRNQPQTQNFVSAEGSIEDQDAADSAGIMLIYFWEIKHFCKNNPVSVPPRTDKTLFSQISKTILLKNIGMMLFSKVKKVPYSESFSGLMQKNSFQCHRHGLKDGSNCKVFLELLCNIYRYLLLLPTTSLT